MSTVFVPRSVKLKLLEKMKQAKLEKEKDDEEKKKAKQEKVLLSFNLSSESSSSSSVSDDVRKRIERSCLQEKLFAMQCDKVSKKKDEKNTFISSSNSLDIQDCQTKQNNTSRHQEYSEKPSRKKYLQDTSKFSNGYIEKTSKQKQCLQEFPKSSINYEEKSKQKYIKDASKSYNPDRQDYQGKTSRQKYSQNNRRSSNSPQTPFSFSLPSDKFNSKISYHQSSSKAESSSPKPSFTLLQNRPIEDPDETFISNNLKSSDLEFLNETSPESSKSKSSGLSSFLSPRNESHVLTYKKMLKKKEKTTDTINEGRKNVQVTSPRKKTLLVSCKKKEESEKKLLDPDSLANFKDTKIDNNKVKLHLKDTCNDKKSKINYYESRGHFEPIDWNELKEIPKQPSKPAEKKRVNTFSLSTDKIITKFSLGQSNFKPESPNIKPFFSLLQNRFYEHSKKTFFVPENFKLFNIQPQKKISPTSSESDLSFKSPSDKYKDQLEEFSCKNVAEKKEETINIMDSRNKNQLKASLSKNMSEKQEKTISILEVRSKDQSKASLFQNVAQREEKTTSFLEIRNKKNSELELLYRISMSHKKKEKPQNNESTQPNQVAEVSSPKSLCLEPLQKNDNGEKKENDEESFNLQNTCDNRQNIKNYYESRGNFGPINWDEMTKPLNKNSLGMIPKRNKEPNELLKVYSSNKPDITTEAIEFFNFIDNTTSYQTIFEVGGNLEKNPQAMKDPIIQIQRKIHGNNWNVCYLPKEIKTFFKKSVQKSTIADNKIILDYTQAKKTPNSLPIKTVPKKQKISPEETNRSSYTQSITSLAQYEDKLELTKPQALREFESTLSKVFSKNYKRAVHDYTDDLFEFDIPKEKSSSRANSKLNSPLNSILDTTLNSTLNPKLDSTLNTTLNSKLDSTFNSTLNSTLDSDDTPQLRSSKLNDPAICIESKKLLNAEKKIEVFKQLYKNKSACRPLDKITYVTEAEKAFNEINVNEKELSLEKKCIKYLNECVKNKLATKEEIIKIEEIKMTKMDNILLKPVSTRYFVKEEIKEQNLEEEQKENISELIAVEHNLNEIPYGLNSDVPQKTIEIKNEDRQEKSIDESDTVKLSQPIFSDSCENNQKSSTDGNNNSDKSSETQLIPDVIRKIESDSELNKIKNTYELEYFKGNESDDFEEFGEFDVVGNFLDHFMNIEDTKTQIVKMLEAGPDKSLVKSSNSNKNSLNLVNDNIFKNVNITDYYGSSVSKLINEDKENIRTSAPCEMSNRKKKKLAWLEKASHHFKNTECEKL